ncbi:MULTISPECIES: twin-arginine translocation signal domain-containing protein [Salinibaculum]|uniref:twin-arginine translocation signal domain-containing protein n=1 Tax=Salinibaculum TaxID=2732368 RepID=UPI0030CBD3DC
MLSRREFLTTIATGGAVAGAGTVTASQLDPYETQPDFVTISYDEDFLSEYQPRLVTRTLDVKPSKMYAWRVDSTERSTTMACYWTYYVTQQGLSGADSHLYDREPVYVEVDETGAIESVHVDGYHYLLKSYPSAVPTTGETHPTLKAVNPYHFYVATTEVGETVDLADMHDRYGPWIRNGWNVHEPAVLNPWKVKSRKHWWPDGTFGYSRRAFYWDTLLGISQSTGIDVRGAQESDLT